jgi:hypothetical protein
LQLGAKNHLISTEERDMLAFDLSSLMQMAADFEFRKTYKAQNVETEELSLSERKKDFNRMTGGPQTPRGV